MSARFRARAPGPISGQLYEPIGGGPIDLVRFPVAFRPPAFASWASLPAKDFGLRYLRLTATHTPAWRTRTGFPCSARMRHDWGWAPPIPRGRWCPHGRAQSLAATCRLPTAGPCHPGIANGTVNLRSCGRSANRISLIRHTRPGESRRRTGENRPRTAQVDSAARRNLTIATSDARILGAALTPTLKT